MFPAPLSKLEYLWLTTLRLAWQYRLRRNETIRLINGLLRNAGRAPVAQRLFELFDALESAGADHLYLESFDRTDITGDERDLLAALCACYQDDLLAAEQSLSALLPPGDSNSVLALLCDIARAPAAVSPDAASRPMRPDFPAALALQ